MLFLPQVQEPGQTSKPEAPVSDIPVLKVVTRLVVVDAVVTDGSGKSVKNLKAEDFEILENGKPQVVRAFEVIALRPPAAGSKPAELPVLPPGVFTNVVDYHRPEDGPPTIILVDALNTALQDQAYLQDQLVKYMRTIGPRRNVAVYTLESRLRLVQDFTTDPKLLLDAMKKVGKRQSPLNHSSSSDPLDLNSTDPIRMAMNRSLESLQNFQARQETFELDQRVKTTTEALRQLARNMAGFPGRKNLIWLSGGFPIYVEPNTSLGSPSITERLYSDEVRVSASALNDSQVAIYPVDAHAPLGSFMPDASKRVSGEVYWKTKDMDYRMARARNELAAVHDSMNTLAEQTGGRAFFDRADIARAVNLSFADGSEYYSLGYYPENKNWDGKFRKIQVKMARKDLHVRHRRGYFAINRTPGTRENDKAAVQEFGAALYWNAPTATMVPFTARVVPPSQNQPEVSVDFEVDPRALYFENRGDNLAHAKINFAIAAFNSAGKLVTGKADIMTAALTPEIYDTLMKTRLAYRQTITLAPGKYVLKLGVHDAGNNLIGTINARVEVPAS